MKYYTSKYFDDLTAWPVGVGCADNKKLPLRVRFALWLFGFKKHKDASRK